MASVFRRPNTKTGKLWIKFKDETGRWRSQPTSARTKEEARRIAAEEELRGERRFRGLEPMPLANAGGTIAELMTWYLDEFASKQASFPNTRSAVGKHILSSWLAELSLVDVTQNPHELEKFLHEKDAELQPGSVNHLRKFLDGAFRRAIAHGRWNGANPVASTKKRRVLKRAGQALSHSEVERMLLEIRDVHRDLFATAVYTGLRKGELFGLHKRDVDLAARRLYVRSSHERDITKGGHQDPLHIPEGLVPHLERAISRSDCEYVFPNRAGALRSKHQKLDVVLRGALGRAGIVDGYTHVCRYQGCTHREEAQDADLRRCPLHSHKLWPKARARHVRFHDLRHTTATLLFNSGACVTSVQKILRHSDPRTTVNTYGHLDPLMRSDSERLRFAPLGPPSSASSPPLPPSALPPSPSVPFSPSPPPTPAAAGSPSAPRRRARSALTGTVAEPAAAGVGVGGRRAVVISSVPEGGAAPSPAVLVQMSYTELAPTPAMTMGPITNPRKSRRKSSRAMVDSNHRPLASEANALSS